MAAVRMYSTAICPYCVRAERLLERKGVEVEKIRVDLDPERYGEMVAAAGGLTSVPQIFIGDRHVGGCDELVALERSGRLDAMLAEAGHGGDGD